MFGTTRQAAPRESAALAGAEVPRLAQPCLVLLLCWWALQACASQPPKAASAFEALRENPDRVIERIAWLRRLPQRRQTRLIFHEPAEFRKVVAEQVAGGARPTTADHPAFQHAFGFAGARGQAVDSLANVQQDEVIAFFDERSFSVHVRSDAGNATADELSPAWIVAHEVGHSLQHQHFRIPDIAGMTSEDMRLAALSMLEGDAMLVMLAYASYEQHVPLTRTIVRVGRALERDIDSPYASVGQNSAALERAPASVRERLVFPYLSGALFMGSLYRTGGYELVNRVYDFPPTSSEQVIHPQKYLAGELAVPVAAPLLPQGYQRVAAGSMGELQIRTLLSACAAPERARLAAAGWGGDAFAIGVRGAAGLLLWATTWDSVRDAEEFQHLVESSAKCWSGSLGSATGVTFTQRLGEHVAIVRGLSEAWAEAQLGALLTLPQARPVSQPRFGSLALRTIPPEPEEHPAYLHEQAVIAPYLGLVVPLASGFRADLKSDIVLEATQGGGSMVLLVSEWVVQPATNEQLFQEFLTSFTQGADFERSQLEETATSYVPTPLGPAFQRTYRVKQTPVGARLLIVPACQATGALLVAQSWSNETMRKRIDWMVSQFRTLGTSVPPLCAHLNP